MARAGPKAGVWSMSARLRQAKSHGLLKEVIDGVRRAKQAAEETSQASAPARVAGPDVEDLVGLG